MKPNWKYISLFIILAIGISSAVHLGYIDKTYEEITTNWIIQDWVYILAALGPFLAGLITLHLQKSISKRISILGNEKFKYILIALLPVFSFSIVGFQNSYGINIHYYGFLYALINVVYAFLEEFGWRIYLQNALEGINKNWKYILIGIIWWIWHLRFDTDFDLYVFPFICIGSGYFLGKLADETKSVLPVVAMHTLIILATNSGHLDTRKVIGIVIVILGWIGIEQIWKRRKTVKNKLKV